MHCISGAMSFSPKGKTSKHKANGEDPLSVLSIAKGFLKKHKLRVFHQYIHHQTPTFPTKAS
jgi:hypothetical protein